MILLATACCCVDLGAGELVDAREDFDDWGVEKPGEFARLCTERENACAQKGLPVYRALFTRA